jgi:glycosyltransferase involved in cell wall biosynthesis
MKVLFVSCGAGRLARIAKAFQDREALAGLWTSEKNRVGIAADKFRRAWSFHLVMKPFYHLTSVGIREKAFHRFFPIWRRWVRKQQCPPFDAVHCLMGYGSEPFDLADKAGALKVVDAGSSHPTTAHGFWQRECDLWCPGARPGVPRWLFARTNRELARADLILCSSLFVRDSMLYNGIAETKCVLSPYGVDGAMFAPRTALPEKPRFVCVGAISLRKGYQYLFRAFAKVRETLPDAELVCIGNFFPDFKLERPRWEGSFVHLENLPHSELSRILREATAFVFPSNEEGFAKAVIEAMSAGLPIVATHESGATTLVRDGIEGIIVRSRSVDQLTAAMMKLASDQETNLRMGRAARIRGTTNNSWADYTNRLLGIYEQALSERLPSRASPQWDRGKEAVAAVS